MPRDHCQKRIAAAYQLNHSRRRPDHPLVTQLLIAWGLLASNVAIHATGMAYALGFLRRRRIAPAPAASTWLFVSLAGWIVSLHITEIMVWALVYTWRGALPDVVSAMYFSAVTYTTTGYGDVVLPPSWPLVGAVEALTGILMCGWSTGFFFAVLNRQLERSPEA